VARQKSCVIPLRGRGATGTVIGQSAGIRPYIYVTRLDEVLRTAAGQGAEIVTPPYPEGSLTIATLRDPAGNVIGIWQDGTH
jgi:predicted enzyme related to lactoylglutathione lyase